MKPAFGSNATICFNPTGDGSCQFEAYAHELNKIGIFTSGDIARESAVNYMLKNPYVMHGNKKTHLFEFVDKRDHKDWDSYLTGMKRRATYGDNLTLQALSNVYNVRILVVTAAATHLQTNNYHLIEPTSNDLESVAGTVCLGHYSESTYCHYVCLLLENIDDIISNIHASSIHCKSTGGIEKEPVKLLSDQSRQDTHASNSTGLRTGPNSPSMPETKNDTSARIKSVTELQHTWWAKLANPDNTADRAKYRCEPCWTFKNTIGKMCSYRGKIPGICTESGIVFRAQVFSDHAQSQLHKEAVKAYNVQQLSAVDRSLKTDMGLHVSKANEILANRIGGLMIEIYNNAKRGTISAWSWPSTHIAHQMASEFKMNAPAADFLPLDSELKYITPMQHSDLMSYIVKSDLPKLKEKILSSLAVSISVDGSVDRFQEDNKHVKCKIVTADGNEEDIFLGFDTAHERKTAGYVGAVKSAVEWCVPWTDIFKKTCCIVTDGENANTGERNSLWASLDKERLQSGNMLPFIKIWCGVHRSDLAFSSVSKTIPEVHTAIQDAVSLATYFHTSGMRTKEMEELAASNGFRVMRIPKYFEVRWTEFTYRLFNSILCSWRAVVKYLQTSKDNSAKGHLSTWTEKTKLNIVCLIADVLLVYSQFQKSIQSNHMTLTGLHQKVEQVKQSLNSMLDKPLLGGWESEFTKNVTEQDEFYGVQLAHHQRRRREHHSFVSDIRDYSPIRTEVIISLVNFIDQRFCSDHSSVNLTPLSQIRMDVGDEEIEACHGYLIPDLDLAQFAIQYRDVASTLDVKLLRNPSSVLKHIVQSGADMTQLATALARFLVLKPHSADVERLIKSYNLIKTIDRANMKPETLKNYLYIQHNMPVLTQFDARSAVLMWMKDKERRNVVPLKYKEQRWFKSVFAAANCCGHETATSLNEKIGF